MSDNVRITVKILTKNKKGFLDWFKKFGISKDKFLATQLSKELQYLKTLPANSPKGKKIDRALLLNKDSERLNITLPQSVAEEMNEVCNSIGVARDTFIDMYLDFLLNGDDEFGSCTSPLKKIEAMLDDPRFEYSVQ